MLLVPAARRHEASKFGHAFCEQSRPTCLMSRRSPFAKATGTLASTCGAKPGRIVRPVAMSAAMATAESALIMTVPCHGPPTARYFVGWTSNQVRFRDVFSVRENGFVGRQLCFVTLDRTKHCA